MRLLWTLVKVVIALAIVVPLCIIALGMALGLFSALLGLAFLALRLAVVGLLIYGGIRVAAALFGGRRSPPPVRMPELKPVDPYYEAAKRELDRELGEAK